MRSRARRGALEIGVMAWAVGLACGVPVWAAAGDKEKPATTVRTSDGLHFQVPPDWPIEKRNGAVGPIPVEEYLAKKFSAVENRLHLLEQQVGALDIKIRVLEEQAKKQSSLQSSGSGP